MNNTGADRPAQSCSLISAFVIHLLERIICILATGEITIFWLVSVAEETGLKFALSEPLKRGWLFHDVAQFTLVKPNMH